MTLKWWKRSFPNILISSRIRSNGWRPIDWAQKAGNPFTYTRTARLIGHVMDEEAAKALLKKYVHIVTWIERGDDLSESPAEKVWNFLCDGKSFEAEDGLQIASPKIESDIRYLLSKAKVATFEQLNIVVGHA